MKPSIYGDRDSSAWLVFVVTPIDDIAGFADEAAERARHDDAVPPTTALGAYHTVGSRPSLSRRA